MDKGRFLDLKKLVNEENPSGQRLQSLRLPRDLNLGGAKVNKKQFVPNLNVVRNKDKIKEVTKRIEQKRNLKNNDKSNQHNNSGQRFSQSSGIFSDGIGLDGKKIYRNGTKHSSSKENDYTYSLPVPTIKKNAWEYVEKNEEKVFNQIMADEDELEDEKLPFQIISWNEKDFKDVPLLPVKSDVKVAGIKIEPGETEMPDLPQNKLNLDNMHCPLEYQNENSCSDDHPALTLWRLPDSFPGRRKSEDPNCQKLLDYGLQDMPEGQIGKLILRKSGRAEIQIGKMKYNLDPAELCSCREEIVAMDVKENQESSAAILGQIQNNYLLVPDWDSLLKVNRL